MHRKRDTNGWLVSLQRLLTYPLIRVPHCPHLLRLPNLIQVPHCPHHLLRLLLRLPPPNSNQTLGPATFSLSCRPKISRPRNLNSYRRPRNKQTHRCWSMLSLMVILDLGTSFPQCPPPPIRPLRRRGYRNPHFCLSPRHNRSIQRLCYFRSSNSPPPSGRPSGRHTRPTHSFPIRPNSRSVLAGSRFSRLFLSLSLSLFSVPHPATWLCRGFLLATV